MCPPLSDVLPRCFPYTTLNNLDFLTVKVATHYLLLTLLPTTYSTTDLLATYYLLPTTSNLLLATTYLLPTTYYLPPTYHVKGYVGGSTNPIFESHPEW